MSSMYLYCAFQSSEEFSALETIFMAISFFAGSSSPAAATAATVAAGRTAGSGAAVAWAATGTARRALPSRAPAASIVRWGVNTRPPWGELRRPGFVRKLYYQS